MTDDVVVVAIAMPAEGRGDAVRRALLTAVAEVHDEPGCETYALHEREDGALVMIERWTGVDALDEHGRGAALQRLGAALQGNLAAPLDVTRMRPLPAGDPAKGAL